MANVDVTGSGSLALKGEATIHFAQELHQGLTTALAQLPGAIQVQAGQLEALDLVGAQILLAFRRSLAAGRVTFSGWPAPIADFLATSGLEALFA